MCFFFLWVYEVFAAICFSLHQTVSADLLLEYTVPVDRRINNQEKHPNLFPQLRTRNREGGFWEGGVLKERKVKIVTGRLEREKNEQNIVPFLFNFHRRGRGSLFFSFFLFFFLDRLVSAFFFFFFTNVWEHFMDGCVVGCHCFVLKGVKCVTHLLENEMRAGSWVGLGETFVGNFVPCHSESSHSFLASIGKCWLHQICLWFWGEIEYGCDFLCVCTGHL